MTKLFLIVAVGACISGWNCFNGNSSKMTDESKVMADRASIPPGVPSDTYLVKCASDSVKISCDFTPVTVVEKTVQVEYEEVVKKTKQEKVLNIEPKD